MTKPTRSARLFSFNHKVTATILHTILPKLLIPIVVYQMYTHNRSKYEHDTKETRTVSMREYESRGLDVDNGLAGRRWRRRAGEDEECITK
ncbi:hypothetical protein Tco_0993537 [Tanacetum coccineum]